MDSKGNEKASRRDLLEKIIVTLGMVLNVGGVVFQALEIFGTIYGACKEFIAWRARRRQMRKVSVASSATQALDNTEGISIKLTVDVSRKISTNSQSNIFDSPTMPSNRHLMADADGCTLPCSPLQTDNRSLLDVNMQTETERSLLSGNIWKNLFREEKASEAGDTRIEEQSRLGSAMNRVRDDENNVELIKDKVFDLGSDMRKKAWKKKNRRKENFSFGLQINGESVMKDDIQESGRDEDQEDEEFGKEDQKKEEDENTLEVIHLP